MRRALAFVPSPLAVGVAAVPPSAGTYVGAVTADVY